MSMRLHDDAELFTDDVLASIRVEHKVMKGSAFMKRCTACGGNWTAMMLTGMEVLYPLTFEALPDIQYGFLDICEILLKLGVDFSEE